MKDSDNGGSDDDDGGGEDGGGEDVGRKSLGLILLIAYLLNILMEWSMAI